MEDVVEKARRYATSAHARINQLRKYSLKPYDVHLKAVAGLVASVTGDRSMIAASWLHDTVEDTPVTFEDLEREFGADVMNLVKELTDVSKPGDGNRAARKTIDLQHLAEASPRAKTIKLADIIDNCGDICRHDPKFGRVYLGEMQALLQVLNEGDRRLYDRAAKTLADCAGKLDAASRAVVDSTELRRDAAAAAKRVLKDL
ncbi:MAG TPA: HD domain-containing protein, partial [Geobacteraceae bacterium]|nr:HD domain-containing protein [Geobacteraceae bacterium]